MLVKVVKIPGYAPGSVQSFPDHVAEIYLGNGQGEKPGGAETPDVAEVENRMIDTGKPSKRARPPAKVDDAEAADETEEE